MKDFKYWDNLHRNERLGEFSFNRTGLLWLKTKSIIRKELIEAFLQQNEIALKQTALKQQFVELFDLLSKDIDKSHKLLDKYIKKQWHCPCKWSIFDGRISFSPFGFFLVA